MRSLGRSLGGSSLSSSPSPLPTASSFSQDHFSAGSALSNSLSFQFLTTAPSLASSGQRMVMVLTSTSPGLVHRPLNLPFLHTGEAAKPRKPVHQGTAQRILGYSSPFFADLHSALLCASKGMRIGTLTSGKRRGSPGPVFPPALVSLLSTSIRALHVSSTHATHLLQSAGGPCPHSQLCAQPSAL